MKQFLCLLCLFSNLAYSQVNKPQHEPPEVINAYAAVEAFNICSNTITVSDATDFKAGDTVLMIQMKGAVIDTSNTPAFGTILDYGNAGNYEFNFISFKSGNELTFLNKLTRAYDIPDGVVQLVRVPKYKAAYFVGGLIPRAWDGSTGGIVCVLATESVTSVEDIYSWGMGFRGGKGYNASSTSCNQNNYYYPYSSQYAALRGESIGSVSQNMIKGKGSVAGGGGGGNSHNSGGGGGGNGGTGGQGGYQSDSCNAGSFNNGGAGGNSFLYNAATNKIFMGSGGGAGHMDNIYAEPLDGGTGGGIIIIITPVLEMYEELLYSNGRDGGNCNTADCNDGNAGGGAGGTILLSYTNIVGNLDIETKGGKGADMYGPVLPGGKAGPGGGGGGGVLFTSGSSLPTNVNYTTDGGTNGVVQQDANNSRGATSGTAGVNIFNLTIPWSNLLFKPNIDSVRFIDSINYCNNIMFKGLAFTNTFPVVSWQWNFGDGGTSTQQNPVYNYNAVGNYDVKLVVTDINGCKDSIIKTINTAGSMFVDAGADTAYCANAQIAIMLNGNGTGLYSWIPSAGLNNNTLQNPEATINTTTKFFLTLSNGTGCTAFDSVTISIKQGPSVKVTKSNDLNCNKPFAQLYVSGAQKYKWSPAYALSNDSITNPVANPAITTTYYVNAIDTGICMGRDSVTVFADFKNHGIILPNSFTPNNDGLNDCFGIRYHRDVQDLEFIIYNRYGNLVFKTNNATACWNGNYKGKPASPGNYIYFIKAKTLCGDVVMKENIMLIR